MAVPLIFNKSLFKTLADDVISRTTENREVSPAKSLGFDNNPANKSLI